MKAASLVLLSVVGSLLVIASEAGELECGRNMVAAGCECNQVCNGPIRICPKSPCPNTKVVCACLSGFCLPNADSRHCIRDKKCPKP